MTADGSNATGRAQTTVSAKSVSIALATYNGGAYLGQQLDSYLRQTRLPDELVVGDDGSTDDTLRILADFGRRAPFPVHVHVNRPGLGPTANFTTTIGRCTGEVIFLSDQDDVWMADKISTMLAYLAAHPNCLLATHDGALVDSHGAALGTTLASQYEASGTAAERALVAGCCMAIDARLAALLRPIPRARCHDAWLATAADALKARGHVSRPLIDYRRHDSNVTRSFVSDRRRASRWRRFRERARLALGERVLDSLDAATFDRQDLVLAMQRRRQDLAPIVGDEAITSAIAAISADLARNLRRAAFVRGSLLRRPGLLVTAARAGDYSGMDGLLSLARDLCGTLTAHRT